MPSFCNGDAIGSTAGNRIANLTIMATPSAGVVYTQAGVTDMSRIEVSRLTATGRSR